jgi:hypothetical protein
MSMTERREPTLFTSHGRGRELKGPRGRIVHITREAAYIFLIARTVLVIAFMTFASFASHCD